MFCGSSLFFSALYCSYIVWPGPSSLYNICEYPQLRSRQRKCSTEHKGPFWWFFFVSFFRNQIKYQIYQICKYLRNELLQQSESPKVSIDNWQFLIIHISICYQIWILKLKIRSLRDSIFCIESSKMQQLAIEQDFHKKHLCAVTWKSFSLSSIFTW